MTLNNLTAIVTGGCSGLGHATAIALRDAGANVSLFDLNDEVGAQRVEELGKDNTIFTKVDVRDEASVQSAIDATTETFGAISLVVNCAGIAPAKRLLDKEGNPAPLGDFQKTIDINLVGSFNVSRLVAATMAKQPPINDEGERGLIVNTASVAGYEGQIGQTAYAASKASVRNHSKTVALYCAEQGYSIRCNSLHPGAILTPIWDAMLGDGDERESAIKAIASDIPLGTMGTPEDVAYAALYLASDESKYVTGIELNIDGGILAGSAASPNRK